MPLSFGTPLLDGDILSTGANGTAEVQLGEIGTLEISYSTKVRIDGLHLNEKQGAISVLKGSVLSKINKLARPDSFIVRSNTIVCGVRGTVFSVCTDETGKCILDVLEGTVSVFPESLISNGLHPSAALVGIVPAYTEVPDLPVVTAGQRAEMAADTFLKTDAAIEKAAQSLQSAKQGTSASVLISLTTLIREAVPPVRALSDIRKNELEKLKTKGEIPEKEQTALQVQKNPSFICTRKPVEPPLPGVDENPVWPRPEPYQHQIAGKDIQSPMTAETVYFAYNSKNQGSVSGKLIDGRAQVSIFKNTPGEWAATLEQKQTVFLQTGHFYSLEFTAWCQNKNILISEALNEGDIDINHDGKKFSVYTPYQPILVTAEPQRFKILYHHTASNNISAHFNFSFGEETGTVYLQDIACKEIANPVTPQKISTEQLIANGNFSRGFLYWNCQNSETRDPCVFSIKDGAVSYHAESRMNEAWHAQLGNDVQLIKGQTYLLSFDAFLEGKGVFGVDMIENNEDLDTDGNFFSPVAPYLRIELVPDNWQRYRFEFKASETNPRTKFLMNFGNIQGNLLLDNIVLCEKK